MSDLSTLIFFLLLLIYNYVMFSYLSYLYVPTMEIGKIIIMTSLINCVMFIVPHIFLFNNYDPILFYIACYTMQFSYIYKKNLLICFFGALCFTINMYAIGLIVVALIAFITNDSILNQRNAIDMRLLTTISTLVPATLQIIFLKHTIPKEKIDILLSHKQSLELACKILLVVFAYALVIVNIDNAIHIDDTRIVVLNLKVGIVTVIGFLVAIIYSYIFATLHLEVKQFEKYEGLVREEEERIKELNRTVHKDSFTGLYLREVGIERIEFYKEHKINFYVAFIDMDGLKTVNDNFGHNEGDFYILTVTDLLKRNFQNTLIVRLGGDEFLIVGTGEDEYEPTRCTLSVYADVNLVKERYNKSYDTSVSYGIVSIHETRKLDTMSIIALADERMYEFKKSKKKERTVKRVF